MENRVRELREAKGWTREELAVKAGVTFETIRLVEYGRTRPRIDTARRLATALEITVDALFPEAA